MNFVQKRSCGDIMQCVENRLVSAGKAVKVARGGKGA